MAFNSHLPQWELPLYRLSSGVIEAIGSRFKEFSYSLFESILVLRHRETQKREMDAPVIVITDKGQIELSLEYITPNPPKENPERIGIAFDSIKMDGKDGRGKDLAAWGYKWVPLDSDTWRLLSGKPIIAIRLIGSVLKGIEFDVVSRHVCGRFQIWNSVANCSDDFGLSISFVQPLLEGQKRHVICENMDVWPTGF